MRGIRKLALMGFMALLALAGIASSASALTAVDKTTNAALAVGSTVNAHTTSGATLTGTFFGITTSVSCSTSSVVGTVKSNNGTTIAGSIDQLTFVACVNEANNNPCTVTVLGLPWNPTTSGGNTAGLIVTGTSTNPLINLGTGANGIQISGTNCLPFSNTCTFQGGTAGPLTSGAYDISNYVTGAWDTPTSEITLNSVGVKSSTCGTGTWTATYQLRTGSTITGGNPVGIV